MTDEVKKKIEECIEKKDTNLDLSNCGLKEIPEEIEEMDWLKILSLNSNRLYVSEKFKLMRARTRRAPLA